MFRIRSEVSRKVRLVVGTIPFLIILAVYLHFSAARLRENPRDKLMPGPVQLARGWNDVWKPRIVGYKEYTVAPGDTLESIADHESHDRELASEIRSDATPLDPPRPLVAGETVKVPQTERRIVVDTKSSLHRLAVGIGIAVSISLVLGLFMGAFTPVDSTLYYLVTGLAKIPPLAVLPIIFIAQGVDESAKITIIALGVAPTMILDILLRVKEVPREMITKAYTLGASTMEIVFKVILPLIWPSVLNSIRLALGPAWVYLIASEAIAADSGLGYRIFVVQRQLGMNVILIYVGWIMLLGMAMDLALRWFIAWRYEWADQQ